MKNPFVMIYVFQYLLKPVDDVIFTTTSLNGWSKRLTKRIDAFLVDIMKKKLKFGWLRFERYGGEAYKVPVLR